MSEAFLNIIKRDKVYTNDCHTADNVLRIIGSGFADYNLKASRSALGI
jgi:hypothetical protein